MRRLLAGLLVLATAACAGKDGAMGPMGPQGPDGPQGPPGQGGHTIVASGVASSSGLVLVALPAAVGTNATQPPHMDCYVTDDPSGGVWLSVSWSSSNVTEPYCAVQFASGVWHAVMDQVPVGWTAAFVVSY